MAKAKKNESETLVVGVGASAGGLEAFQKFLSHLPDDSGLAFVLIQHLDPNHQTIMPELLSKSTKMSVVQIEDHSSIRPNCIYFIPPNATLTIEDGNLRIKKPSEPRGHRSPIDAFFISLAENKKEEAIGVILSGSGSDGTIGIKAIKEAGGLTFSQSAESAKYDSMPRSAQATGMVDYTLDILEMSEHLVEYIKHRRTLDKDGLSSEAKSILMPVCKLLHRKFNQDFSKYKENTLIRRINKQMQMKRVVSGSDYLDILQTDDAEAQKLLNNFLIGVTYFFRDEKIFNYLKLKVIPQIIKNNPSHIRVWVPGCATGEEAFSLAILFKEVASSMNLQPKVQIFASDLDERSVSIARQASYSEGIAGQVNSERLKRFFNKLGSGYELKKEIRDSCLFSKHNLLTDPPFAKLDLISCRNLFIYLGKELQKNSLSLFAYALKKDGFLVLGPTESATLEGSPFDIVSRDFRIFKNVSHSYKPKFYIPLNANPMKRSESSYNAIDSLPNETSIGKEVDKVILRRYTPPHVVVDAQHEIQYYSGHLEGILSPTKGTPSSNLIQMARPSMRVELRKALLESTKNSRRKVVKNVSVLSETETRFTDIVIEPFRRDKSDTTFYLVVFQKSGVEAQSSGKKEAEKHHGVESEEYERIQNELLDTREQLRITIEELENSNEQLKSSNEELLSLNEEMQSGNEELQTSHEEMQSINEEMEAVNTELSAKLSLLDNANSDLENLFRSTEIATVFLDNDLRIKRYTPEAKSIFHFIETDIERPITDLAPNFEGLELESELNQVIRSLTTRLKTIYHSKEGKWYKLKMHPYKTVNNVIDGAILTFYDVTELKNTENELSFRLKQQSATTTFGLKALDKDIVLKDLFKFVVSTLRDIYHADFTKVLELNEVQEHMTLVAGCGWKKGLVGKATVGIDLDSQAGYTLRSQFPILVEDFENETRFNGPKLLSEHDVKSGISVVIAGPSGKSYGVLGIHSKQKNFFSKSDIQFASATANILATAIEKDRLLRSKEALAKIVQSTQDIIISYDLDGVIATWNPSAERVYGIKAEEALGKSVFDLIVPKDKMSELAVAHEKLRKGTSILELETERLGSFGERIPVSLNLSMIRSGNRISGISSVGRDISAYKKSQEALLNAKLQSEAASGLKSRFMGVLSHELRTPLSSILGYTELILKSEKLSKTGKENIKKVYQNGLLLQSLIKDVLDVSKIEQDKISIEKKWFCPKEFMAVIFSALSAKAENKNITLRLTYLQDPPKFIETDPMRLRQVLENLLSNAIKYTDGGEVNIKIDFKLFDGVDSMVIDVVDTGRGMSEDKSEDLFKPFFRAEPSRGAPGIGLGLYLSKGLAAHLGGDLVLKSSKVNKGSTFTLKIPIQTADVNKGQISKDVTTEVKRIKKNALKGLKILLAEDSEDLRDLFTLYLKKYDAEVEAASDGLQALKIYKSGQFDIVLLDLFMPNMNGDEVMAKIAKDDKHPPVIVLTAHAMKDVRQECLEKGFRDYLSKPVQQETIVRTILKHTNRS